jgi:hypothetical protein
VDPLTGKKYKKLVIDLLSLIIRNIKW